MSSTTNLITLIKQCKTPKQLHQIHAHTTTTASHLKILPNLLHTFTSLLKPSSSPTSLTYATSLFNLIPNPSTFSFNNLIRAHTLLSSPLPALHLFASLRRLSLPPDFHTFPFALKACAHLAPSSFPISQALHSQALKFGFASHSFVANTLIHVYSVCHNLDNARRVFDESPHKDLVTYNAMLDTFVKGGEMDRAREVFDEMPERDSVSWGTVLAGYAQTSRCKEAIELFGEMMESEIRPDDICLVSALSACAQLGDLERGRSIHDYVKRNRTGLSSYFLTALVDLYAKCGCIETALKIFESSSGKNVFTWNAMLVGLAMHGHADLSMEYFSRMIEAGVKPDGISFLGFLVGCSHGGKVDEARKLFDEMESVYGVPKELKHYGCMADLLGRAGLIKEAMEMIEKMPMGGDVFVWGGLLGGCKIHGDVESAKTAAEHVMELDPEDGGVYSIMASVYATADKWDDVVKTRKSISANKRVKKNSGCSLIRLLLLISITLLKIMAFRSMNQWQRVVCGLRGYATSTLPKMRAYNPTANMAEQQSSKKPRGDFVPVYVAVGMIALSVSLGLHTAKQQLFHNPNVFVKKDRREMLPEVVEPDRVVEDADKFVNKSFFRKVAHVQEFDNPVKSDSIHGDVYAQRPRAVTLKEAGVDPKKVAEGLDPRIRARLGVDPKN
ncbi:hypothetical protein ACLB2K_051783 [Fragaria x ananassa]